MSSGYREQQIQEWNGPTAVRWVTNQDWIDHSLTAYGEATLRASAVRPGESVLDVGCGAGATTLELARRVGEAGRVVGVDISEPLLGRARERASAAGLSLQFELADAGRHAFAPASFDLLFSRFGVMFFDDPTSAFTSLRRALKIGGRLAFSCWRSPAENPWFMLPIAAVKDILPPRPFDPLAPGPFAYADRTRLEGILGDAGFSEIAFAPFDAPLMRVASAERDTMIEDALGQALKAGPLSRMLDDQSDELRGRALDSVRSAIDARLTPAGLTLDGACWIVTARA